MSVAVVRRFAGWKTAIVLYALAAFAGLAGVLIAPGTIGHHWDWLIPSDPHELRHFAWTSGFAWQDFAFGSYVTYRYATTLTSFLFGAPGFIGLGGAFVTKALLFFGVFVSGAGMRFLLLTLTRDRTCPRDGAYATFGGLLYALAPYGYNQIVAGDQSALIADAVSPIAIALAVRAVYGTDRRWIACALGVSLLLATIVASAQVFVFTIVLTWAMCLALRPVATTALRLALATATGIALCAFWIVPAFLAGGAVHTVVQTASPDRAFATLQQFSNPLLTLTTLAFPGDFYLHALGAGAPAYFAAFAAMLAACVTALVKRRTPLLVVLAIAFVVFSLLPLGGNPVLGPPILALFRSLLPYSLFLRTPQHMMFVVSLVFPILVYLSARAIPSRYFAASLAGAAVVFLAYAQGFVLHSNFFGLVGPFRETSGEADMVDTMSEPGNERYRTLFVPNAGSFYYHPGVFDYYFEGADEPQVRFVPGIAMAAGAKWSPYDGAQSLLKALDELVPDGAPPEQQRLLLRLAAVKHIVVHDIGVPGAGVRLAGDHARASLEAALHRSGIATLDKTLDDRTIWIVPDAVTRTYVPDCVFGVPSNADVYDFLALAPAASRCSRPATIAAAPEQRSEVIVPATTFEAQPRRGIPLGSPKANVDAYVSDTGDGFSASIPPGVQDVEMLALPRLPAAATGVSFRMSSSAPRRIWVQLYAPDFRNFYQANVDFSGQVQDVAINFDRFSKIGHPSLSKLRYLRFASRNAELRPADLYFGSFRWIDGLRHSTAPKYLAIASNRWDPYYYGGDRENVLFEAVRSLAPVYARVRLPRDGTYDVDARVQEDRRPVDLQVGVDGRDGACTSPPLHSDVSQRVVRLARLRLRAGLHQLRLRYCRRLPVGKTDVGLQSLIFAQSSFAPPAQRTGGGVDVVRRQPGTMTLRSTGTFVVFTDAFDDRWSAVQNGIVLQHVTVNGYANGWLVPQPQNGPIVLSFWPQRPLDAGIDLTVALGLLTLFAIAGAMSGVLRHVPVKTPVAVQHGAPGEAPSRG
jgi:hypothetical protein